jgi:hypothetical protein
MRRGLRGAVMDTDVNGDGQIMNLTRVLLCSDHRLVVAQRARAALHGTTSWNGPVPPFWPSHMPCVENVD